MALPTTQTTLQDPALLAAVREVVRSEAASILTVVNHAGHRIGFVDVQDPVRLRIVE